MFVKLIQVVEKTFLDQMTTKITGEYKTLQTYKSGYTLQPVMLNVDNVVYFRSDDAMKLALSEGKMPENLSQDQEFTRIFVSCSNNSNSSMVVVGNVSSVLEKVIASGKK
jgi:hypothetical protein